jgi:sulfur carrier protein
MPDKRLNIIVNGQSRTLDRQATVAELLEQLEIPPRGVAVEVNLEIVPRIRHAERLLADGDRLEIVTLVVGG